MQPDHDRLSPEVRAAIDRAMAHYEVRDPFDPAPATEQQISRLGALTMIGAIMLAAWLLVAALIVLTRPTTIEPVPNPFPAPTSSTVQPHTIPAPATS